MKNLLDLRKQYGSDATIIEKVIFQKRPWYVEVAKVLAVVVIVGTVVWGISKADEIISPVVSAPAQTTIGIYGTVGSFATTTLTIINAQGQEVTGYSSFDVLLGNVSKIETSNYVALTLADIQIGDTIIAKGFQVGGSNVIDATSIISFSTRKPLSEDLATTTLEVATSTDPFATSTATSTDATATSTATSTESVLDKVGGLVNDVINLITGGNASSTATSTATTTEAVATTTATTTPDTTTASSSTPTEPTPVVCVDPQILNGAKDGCITPESTIPPVPAQSETPVAPEVKGETTEPAAPVAPVAPPAPAETPAESTPTN